MISSRADNERRKSLGKPDFASDLYHSSKPSPEYQAYQTRAPVSHHKASAGLSLVHLADSLRWSFLPGARSSLALVVSLLLSVLTRWAPLYLALRGWP